MNKIKQVEGYWDGFLSAKCENLTPDQILNFTRFSYMEKSSPAMPDDLLSEMRKNFQFSVIEKRLAVFDRNGKIKDRLDLHNVPDISPWTIVWCASISSTPGDCVLWAYTLWCMWRKAGKRITLTEYASAFPVGIPTDNEKLRIWDSQKQQTSPSNFVDDMARWPLEIPKSQKEIFAESKTRGEYLEHCKREAIKQLDLHVDYLKVLSQFSVDLDIHPETRDHPARQLIVDLMRLGQLSNSNSVKEFILGYN